LLSEPRIDHVIVGHNKEIWDICTSYHYILHLKRDKLTHTDLTLILNAAQCKKGETNWIIEAQKNELNRHVDRMLPDEIIRNILSP
jgi:hypothetical protein